MRAICCGLNDQECQKLGCRRSNFGRSFDNEKVERHHFLIEKVCIDCRFSRKCKCPCCGKVYDDDRTWC